jgi:hypothetical protein
MEQDGEHGERKSRRREGGWALTSSRFLGLVWSLHGEKALRRFMEMPRETSDTLSMNRD